jgi:alkanesulfonate monooxygenase SsuD/methylene tetrahydromethanopterin reductase-like flavin-dependent oxidoreductase (luciferase family)
MMEFRPTLPPPGRLVRLGLILDGRNARQRFSDIARMCDGVGIDAVWVRDQLASTEGEARQDAWTLLDMIASDVRKARLGAIVNMAFRPPDVLAEMARTFDSRVGGRLEICLSGGAPETHAEAEAEHYGSIVREPNGPVLSLEAASPHGSDVAARVADDVLLPASNPTDTVRLIGEVRQACERNDRDPASIGIAMQLPVSIGRTTAEAQARADAESLFEVIGTPQEVGAFGTLEQCQERVIELAHAGISDLRCVVPNAPDLPDVLAQLTSIAIGTVDVLAPGAPKSKAPDPPEAWGGRGTEAT